MDPNAAILIAAIVVLLCVLILYERHERLTRPNGDMVRDSTPIILSRTGRERDVNEWIARNNLADDLAHLNFQKTGLFNGPSGEYTDQYGRSYNTYNNYDRDRESDERIRNVLHTIDTFGKWR